MQLLDENTQLIQVIVETQNKGRAVDAMQYQQMLYRNLLYLAGLVDPSMNTRDLLPKPSMPRPSDHGGGHMQGYPTHQMAGHPTPSPHHPPMPTASYASSPYMSNMGMGAARQPMSQPNGQYIPSGGGQGMQGAMHSTAGYQPPTSSVGLAQQQQMRTDPARQHYMSRLQQEQMMHASTGGTPHAQMGTIPSYSPSQGIPGGAQNVPRQPTMAPPPTYSQPQM
jgi:protein SSXT